MNGVYAMKSIMPPTISRKELNKEKKYLKKLIKGTDLYIITNAVEDFTYQVIRVAVGGNSDALTENLIQKLQVLGYKKNPESYWCIKLFTLKD